MEYILKDFSEWSTLRPLTLTRSVADIRIGILTIREKWNSLLQADTGTYTENYLQNLYGNRARGKAIIIRSSVLPDELLVKAVKSLEENSVLFSGNLIIAMHGEGDPQKWDASKMKKTGYSGDVARIEFPWDIFTLNAKALEADFALLTTGKTTAPVSASNKIIGNGKVFLEEGAKCEAACLNTTDGPVYIGKNAEIMEGSLVRGPFALCNDSQLKMGAKIYGATTIGPHCKVGGEVTNSVIFGYSNKAHDGFLGNSVIGEWCNLGADTNNSNLKNNYGIVTIWSYDKNEYISTGLQFCGLIMGDHSKSGINTMFNTGTVVGVSANIYGGGFPKKHLPSFTWGGKDDLTGFELNKALEVMERVMERRKKSISPAMKEVIVHIYESGK